ncbi:MAG: glycosyltransferase [Candidatus Saccharibacteria bacterium]|nr:glycosyltransferase [Candidatus Saccharibacteria bacterium]
MKKDIVLTVGITAHAEGVLAHKTMKAVFAGLEELDAKKYPYEIIVHIDNGTEPTINYFKRYEKDKRIRIINSHFGDLGMSRNCIAENARGKYISFLDADDMLSSNWYVSALKRIEESKDTIMIHPNIQFNFGAGTRLEFTERKDSFEKYEDAIVLAGVNRWCSAIMGERKTFLKYPYMKTENGYGYEDYCLNSNTVGHGIKHMVARDTVMFYRQKAEGSLLTSSNSDRVIQPYVSLFDIDYMKTISETEIQAMRPRTVESRRRGGMLKVYYAIRENNFLNYFITPVAILTKKVLRIRPAEEQKGGAKIPDFMMREWKKINEIETQLYPTKEALREIFQAEPDNYDVGLAYYDLVKSIPSKPDYVFIVPWVRVGGADKVLINYLKAIKYHHPKWAVAVITTMPGKNVKKEDLPDNSYIIDFGNRASTLWPTQREILFSRLMTQLQCKKIHIINSEYGYVWAMTHKKFMEHECDLAVSIFSTKNKYTPEMGTYANPFLLDIYNVVKNIYTDNYNMVEDLINLEGFDKKRIKVIHQPIEEIKQDGNKLGEKSGDVFRILWAGRVDDEKNPKILPKIASKLGDKYKIEMFGELAKGYSKTDFSGSNIEYKGKFSDFTMFKKENYDLFLYTSLRDGMPNVLLEAASIQLPIVASNIGGVGDFVIDGLTGVLVNDILEPEEYAKAIRGLNRDHKKTKELVEASKSLMKKSFSWKSFYEQTKDVF